MEVRNRNDDSALSPRRAWAGSKLSARVVRAGVLTMAMLGGVYLCFRMAMLFFTPLATAFMLAVLFNPLHRKISSRIKRPNWAALATVILIAVLVAGALVIIIAQLVREAAAGALLIRAAFQDGIVQELFAAHPALAPIFQASLDLFNAAGLAADLAAWLTDVSAAMLRGSIFQLAGVLLTLYLLFYMLRDQSRGIGALHSLLPFTEGETNILLTTTVDTVNATVFGMIVTGGLLGLLGGIIFAVAGLPAPVLWGAIMAVFAILPVLGIAMVWIPAALWLALKGEWATAALMTTAFVGLSVADGLVYPYLVGSRMRLHTAIAFIGAIGGLIVFGPAGFIVGPLVLALTLAVKDLLYDTACGAEVDAPRPDGPG